MVFTSPLRVKCCRSRSTHAQSKGGNRACRGRNSRGMTSVDKRTDVTHGSAYERANVNELWFTRALCQSSKDFEADSHSALLDAPVPIAPQRTERCRAAARLDLHQIRVLMEAPHGRKNVTRGSYTRETNLLRKLASDSYLGKTKWPRGQGRKE